MTVARIGGDKFVVVLPNVDGRENAAEVVRKIIQALCSPFHLGMEKHEVRIGTSIGIAICPVDSSEMDALIKVADSADPRIRPV